VTTKNLPKGGNLLNNNPDKAVQLPIWINVYVAEKRM
jgi:hypothetical protein